MSQVSIRIDDQAVNAALNKVEARAGSAAPLYRDIADILIFSTQRSFETETSPDGAKWQRLSPRTAAKRIGSARRGFGNILRSEGHLYGSITGESGENSAAIGSNLVYAAIHQLGGTVVHPARERTLYLARRNVGNRFVKESARIRKRETKVSVGAYPINIPARPFLGISNQAREDILEAAVNYYGDAA